MVNKVTFTGIDERTNVEDLVNLQKKYPFIEFGVLISILNTGSGVFNRYPSLEKVKEFTDADLNLSCHICGKLAREVIGCGNLKLLKNYLKELYDRFSRFQFNVNGFNHYVNFKLFDDDKNIIIQSCNDASFDYFLMMKELNGDRVHCLLDKSGGTGKSVYFDKSIRSNEYLGYAGGISEENIDRVLTILDGLNADKSYWVDMESSIRTEDDWFSIDKVEEICKKIKR